MANFIAQYMRDLISQAPYGQNQQAEFRAWLKQFAHWLFDTDHISVRYEIVYDGRESDLEHLADRKRRYGLQGHLELLLNIASVVG